MLSRRTEPGAAAAERPAKGLLARLRRHRDPGAPTRRTRHSDLVIAALGIALGFGCALFPWYIFFNQDKFGVRAMKFEGNPDQIAPISMGDQGERDGLPTPADLIPATRLDLFATGTVDSEEDEPAPQSDLQQQPFPGAPVEYRMVFASAGRAMIADDTGMWVVQRGSLLPDNSKVASIEQRGKTWVLVTSKQRVIELSQE